MNLSKTGLNFLNSLDAPYLVDVLLLPLEYLFSPINFAGQGSGRERERERGEGSGGEEGRSHYRGDATDPLPPSIDAGSRGPSERVQRRLPSSIKTLALAANYCTGGNKGSLAAPMRRGRKAGSSIQRIPFLDHGSIISQKRYSNRLDQAHRGI